MKLARWKETPKDHIFNLSDDGKNLNTSRYNRYLDFLKLSSWYSTYFLSYVQKTKNLNLNKESIPVRKVVQGWALDLGYGKGLCTTSSMQMLYEIRSRCKWRKMWLLVAHQRISTRQNDILQSEGNSENWKFFRGCHLRTKDRVWRKHGPPTFKVDSRHKKKSGFRFLKSWGAIFLGSTYNYRSIL